MITRDIFQVTHSAIAISCTPAKGLSWLPLPKHAYEENNVNSCDVIFYNNHEHGHQYNINTHLEGVNMIEGPTQMGVNIIIIINITETL